MITEDYVSYDTSKLLREKGFNGLCTAYYDCFTTNNFHCGNDPTDFNSIDTKIRNIVAAPTLQMVMKWLREEHNIGIFPTTFYRHTETFDGHNYGCTLVNIKTFDVIGNFENCTFPADSYEQACEAAIKYCLEKLI